MVMEGLAARWPWQWALRHVCFVCQGELPGQLHGGSPACLPRESSGLSGSCWAEVGGQCSLDGPLGRMREGPGQGCPLPSRELS